MQRVFLVDQELRPLMPCRPARARWLLTQHRDAVCVGASMASPSGTAGMYRDWMGTATPRQARRFLPRLKPAVSAPKLGES